MSNNYEQPVEPMSRVEDILRGDTTNVPQSRVEDLLKQLIEQGGGGGGSTVIVTPILSEGTKIASISVNGSINDIYAPTDTGSEVSISTIQQTGTKIATLTIDDTDYDIYAPAGGGGTHTENKTLTFLNTATPFNVGDNFVSAVGVFTHDSSYSLQIAVNGTQGVASRLHNGVIDGTSSGCTYINGVFTFDSAFVTTYCGSSTVDFECLYSGGGGGGGNLYGTTDPTSDLGSNGDIYMKYANEIINYKFFEGDISDSRYANPMVVDAPNASYYDVFHVTYDYRGFNGTDEVSYSDLEPGEVIFLPSSTDPINGAQIRLADGKFYLYPSTGYTMHVYKIVGESETEVPSKIEGVYGKVGDRWLNFPGYSEKVLWSGSESISQNASPFSVPNSSYDDISEYDEIQIEYENGNNTAAKRYSVPVELFKTYPNETVNPEGRDVVGAQRTCYPLYDTTDNCIKIYCETSNPIFIKKIIGAKRGESNANSGGVSYSTAEQVVGTWIDGKPIYELTIAKAVNFPGSNTWKTLGIAMSTYNIKQIFDVTIVGTENTNNVPALLHPESVEPIDGNICVYHNFNWNMTSSHIILRYTKTTD